MSIRAARRPLRLLAVVFLLASIVAIGSAESASAATTTITSSRSADLDRASAPT